MGRVPKKIATPIRVEGKVWFANERSTLSSFLAFFLDAHEIFLIGVCFDFISTFNIVFGELL